MVFKYFQISLVAILSCSSILGQADIQKAYRVVNRNISVVPGPASGNAVHLDERADDGIAWILNTEFINGEIEFDIKGKDVLQQSFVGFAFHGVNDTTFDAIYFRPFNFKNSDTARKAHGVQYVSVPKYEWQKLRTEFPGKYEKAVNPAPDPNDWFHARIVVTGASINVFVNGNKEPCLSVQQLIPLKGRRVGFWVGNGSGGDWKNLKITPAK